MNSLIASPLTSAAANSLNTNPTTSRYKIHRNSEFSRRLTPAPTRRSLRPVLKATDDKGSDQTPKPRSVICTDCDGNGAVLCSQCKGAGMNRVEFFNGQFKIGDACWLCGGRKEMLCGNCNGAGFIGGFMSTFDE